MLKKYIDKNSIVFGVGVVVGGALFSMVLANKLPASLGGKA